jgi:hypothetical protein
MTGRNGPAFSVARRPAWGVSTLVTVVLVMERFLRWRGAGKVPGVSSQYKPHQHVAVVLESIYQGLKAFGRAGLLELTVLPPGGIIVASPLGIWPGILPRWIENGRG